MTRIDKDLWKIYDDAWRILDDHKEDLLRYNDTSSLKKAMYNIDSVIVNRRCNSRRGCCRNLDSNTVRIEISEYMLALPEKEILTTMVHELLHCFRDSRGHKGQWSWRANLLKNSTGLNITRVRRIDNESDYLEVFYAKQKCREKKLKIFCRCDKCGHIVARSRESSFTKYPSLYKHRNCGGTFERCSS